MYGKPKETDPEGIYRSQDGGNTWVCINSDKLYGGTGNGNFIVGDMNEFGTLYMSTVGCGIVYGKLSDGSTPPPTTTKPITTTTKPAPTANANRKYGDANCNGEVDIADVVLTKCYLINSGGYTISAEGLLNADVKDAGGGLNAQDVIAIQKFVLKMIDELPV